MVFGLSLEVTQVGSSCGKAYPENCPRMESLKESTELGLHPDAGNPSPTPERLSHLCLSMSNSELSLPTTQPNPSSAIAHRENSWAASYSKLPGRSAWYRVTPRIQKVPWHREHIAFI